MPNPALMLCQKCGIAYWVTALEYQTWQVYPMQPIIENRITPITTREDVIEWALSGEFQQTWGWTQNLQGWVVTFDRPFCPDMACMGELEEVYALVME